MSLQRRLLLYLLICAPLVWAAALIVSVDRARHQVNELFDTEMIRLARQVQATLAFKHSGPVPDGSLPAEGTEGAGEADVRDLGIAVWDADGQLLVADREGVQLTRHPDASGFIDESLNDEPWRVYYLQSFGGEWLVAAGQNARERDELVYDLTASQILPWLLTLPVLLVAMAWAVRRALAPVHQLTTEVQRRDADDLQPVPEGHAPAELRPLVSAMNALFARIEAALAHERRFTADAAHELRTPLAILRAQWDVVRRASGPAERTQAEAKFSAGLERMDRLVTQMLALSRLDAETKTATAAIDWHPIVEQAMSDCLALAERRRIELACEWPPAGQPPLSLHGEAHLLTVLLRNLIDNAARYAPPGTPVTLRIGEDRIEVENDGPALSSEVIARLGERFHRPAGERELGSGLGVSIVLRIAALHGLSVNFGAREDGQGVKVVLRAAKPLR